MWFPLLTRVRGLGTQPGSIDVPVETVSPPWKNDITFPPPDKYSRNPPSSWEGWIAIFAAEQTGRWSGNHDQVPPLEQDIRLQVLSRRHLIVIEREEDGLSPSPAKDTDPGCLGELVGAARACQRLEYVNVRGQDHPSGRLDLPQHVDLKAVHLPDLHVDDGILDEEGQPHLNLGFQLGNRLPRGYDLPDQGIGDFPVRQDGHQPRQRRVLPHLDVQHVPRSDPVVRFGDRLQRGIRDGRRRGRPLLRPPKRERCQRQQEHCKEQPFLHSHPSLPLPLQPWGSEILSKRVNRCSVCVRSPGASGCGPRAPGLDIKNIFFSTIGKHFHHGPSTRCLPLVVFNEIGRLRVSCDGFISALFLQYFCYSISDYFRRRTALKFTNTFLRRADEPVPGSYKTPDPASGPQKLQSP